MAGTISQRISLEGAEDIRKKLEALGNAGQQAFNQIRDAASQPISDPAQIDQTKEAIDQLATACSSLSETLGTVSGAGEQTGTALTNLGEAANKAKESVSNFTVENVKSGSEIAKNTAHVALYGVEIYSLIARHESLTVAIAKLALGGGLVSTAFEALVGVLGGAVVAIGGVTLGIGGAVVALGALAAAATAAAAPYEKLSSTLQRLSENTGVAFDTLQRGQALFEQLGISAEGFGNIMTKIAAELNALDIGAAFKKSADDFRTATNNVIVAEKELLELQLKLSDAGRLEAPIGARERLLELDRLLKVQNLEMIAAEEKLADARVRAAEAAANALGKVLEQVKAIEEGQKGITFDPLTKGETILKALAISMKEAADNGQFAARVLLDFIANVDRLNAVSAGAKFGLKEEDVDRIRRAHGELGTFDEIWRRLQQAGLLIPPETQKALERMTVETENASRAARRLSQAWDSSIFAKFGAAITSGLEQLKAAILNFAAASLEKINSFFAALPPAVDLSMAQVKQVWFEGWAAMANAVAGFFSAIGLSAIADSLRALAEAWKQSAEEAATAGEAAAQRIREAWDQSLKKTEESAKKTGKEIIFMYGDTTQAAETAVAQQTSLLDQLIQKFMELVGAAAAAAAAAAGIGGGGGTPLPGGAPIGGPGGGIGSAASGGVIGGRGTGTSDSNLAWVSRGEHIMPALAVAQPGVLAFLEALRRSGGNLSAVLNGMGRFALGGMVPRAMPAFAAGGLAGGNNVTIQFPGLPAIGGLRASSEVVDELRKAAALAQVRSGGRKPSRYS